MAIQKLDLHTGYALFERSFHETEMHRHYGIELVYCQEGTFDLFTSKIKHKNIYAAIIPSNTLHAFRCEGARCQLLFLDPLSPWGNYVSTNYRMDPEQGVLANPVGISNFFNLQLPTYTLQEQSTIELDKRIGKCIVAIQNQLEDDKLSIKALSLEACLSESRLSHLFKDQVGTSIRQYILWNRLSLALSKAVEGDSLTAAAHAAGFVDSSHFNKVFVQTFGSNPLQTLKG